MQIDSFHIPFGLGSSNNAKDSQTQQGNLKKPDISNFCTEEESIPAYFFELHHLATLYPHDHSSSPVIIIQATKKRPARCLDLQSAYT
ncbi:hypothetical protein EUGRSUZ_A01539 [Eucalyptus grandis]|uniref:Uncharacterized protein n=2 Tax=Eucalyptus grandis TaxID=71139 RepID=A0ACC3M443_EUCGR|nr:hypothetical protein EUGRSUZ_A01539 [Eucalyptus grandis]